MTAATAKIGGGRRRPPPLPAIVRRTEKLSPHFVRVTLSGPELSRFTYPGAASHFKLVLAADGSGAPTLPLPGEDGLVAFDPAAPLVLRTYTARAFRPESSELDIDIFLHGDGVHGDGPASSWARHVQVGQEVAVSSPRASGFHLPNTAEWVLLAGDSSSMPAMATIAESIPDVDVRCLVELEDPADIEALPVVLRDVTQVRARPAGTPPGGRLVTAIVQQTLPSGPGFCWIAAEALAVREIRTELVTNRELDRSAIVTRGYWRAGTSNHPDHDDGTEPVAPVLPG